MASVPRGILCDLRDLRDILVTNNMYNTNSKSYRNLIVWQRSKDLIVQIYKITKQFPKEELYVLSSQMKRCSISVASNIAEGNQRRTIKDIIRFLNIAQGSLIELGCQLDIAYELGFINEVDNKETIETINKTGYLLTKFIQSKYNPKQSLKSLKSLKS